MVALALTVSPVDDHHGLLLDDQFLHSTDHSVFYDYFLSLYWLKMIDEKFAISLSLFGLVQNCILVFWFFVSRAFSILLVFLLRLPNFLSLGLECLSWAGDVLVQLLQLWRHSRVIFSIARTGDLIIDRFPALFHTFKQFSWWCLFVSF